MKFKSLVLATVIGAIAVSGCGILKGKPAKVEPTEQSVLNYCKNNIKGFEEVKPTLGILSSEDPYNVELYECYNDCNLSGDVLDWGSLSIVAGLKTKGALISTITPPLIEEILDKKGNTFIYGHPANGNPLSSYHYLWISFPFKVDSYVLPVRGIIHNYKNDGDYVVLACSPFAPLKWKELKKGEIFLDLAEVYGGGIYSLSNLDSLIYKIKNVKEGTILGDYYPEFQFMTTDLIPSINMHYTVAKENSVWPLQQNTVRELEEGIKLDVTNHIQPKDYKLFERVAYLGKFNKKYSFKYFYKDVKGNINSFTQDYSLKKGDLFTLGNLTFEFLSSDKYKVKLKITNFEEKNYPEFSGLKIERVDNEYRNVITSEYYEQ